MLFNIHFKSDLKWPLKKMTRLYIQKNYKGSGNEIKNLSDNYYDIQNSSYVTFVLCRSCY